MHNLRKKSVLWPQRRRKCSDRPQGAAAADDQRLGGRWKVLNGTEPDPFLPQSRGRRRYEVVGLFEEAEGEGECLFHVGGTGGVEDRARVDLGAEGEVEGEDEGLPDLALVQEE